MSPLEIQRGGFQPGRGTLAQVACLQNIMEVYKARYKKAPLLAFLDIQAAYDSVDRNILYEEC